jgi:opine dehydrogenase
MNITIIGAGNSGLAMAAHLAKFENKITLWNRSLKTIEKIIESKTIYVEGVFAGEYTIHNATTDMFIALHDAELVLITTPADSHKELAQLIANNISSELTIIMNPGRTLGVVEFQHYYQEISAIPIKIAETQTIIYTCRKIDEQTVNIIAMKKNVLLASKSSEITLDIVSSLPFCLVEYFKPSKSIIDTSFGNVGMILHCAPLLLNTGWTEGLDKSYKYYYDGISPTIANFISKIDIERVAVANKLGSQILTTKEWLENTYGVSGNNLYECIQNNVAYKTIDAPHSLNHRYIFEDVSCGLVPLEIIGNLLGLNMTYTKLTIDLASALLDHDFRKKGRNLDFLQNRKNIKDLLVFLKGDNYDL